MIKTKSILNVVDSNSINTRNLLKGIFIFAFSLCCSIVSAQPCVPGANTSGNCGLWITNVNILGTTLNNNSACSSPYIIYPTSGSTTANLTTGNTYTISVTSDGSIDAYCSIWLDSNNDGVFSCSHGDELVVKNLVLAQTSGGSTATASFLVPSLAAAGNARLRVRIDNLISTINTGGVTNPCSALKAGETEDYTVNIIPNGLPACSPNQIIPNPSIEGHYGSNAPQGLQNTGNWWQGSSGSADFLNPGWAPVPQPVPNGTGCMGAFITQNYEEYFGTCLTNPFLAGVTYSIQMSMASNNPNNPSAAPTWCPVDITLYGSTTCGNHPFIGATTPSCGACGCPPAATWPIIAAANYTPTNTWSTITLTFTPSVNINAIILGGPCSVPSCYPLNGAGSNSFPYFYFDNIVTNIAMSIVPSGDLCSNNLVLTETGANAPGTTYQWYFNGTPLAGQTNNTLNVSANGLTPGVYILLAEFGCICAQASYTVVGSSLPTATISYAGPYCQNAANPSPTFGAGATAGTFSASPTGLVFINTTTGQVNLASSTPGTYTITNAIPPSGGCPGASDTAVVTINPIQSAAFSYPSSTFCQSATTASPTITGTAGGTFSSTPSGLIINSSTGVIDLSSPSNTYTVTYTTLNPCGSNSTQTITISNSTSAIISYAGPYCQNNTNPSPILGSGASAGVYTSSPLGLVFISTSTGQVNLSASTAGTYTVTNTVASSGSCPSTSDTALITINPIQSAAFTYSTSTYCQSASTASPTITGTNGGTFSVTPAGLIINTNTGVVNLSSPANTYTVTYTTAGPCSANSIQVITVNPVPTITVTSASICSGQTTTITATPSPIGGTYDWAPGSQTTQSITVSPTTTTNYTVTYSLSGCTATATTTVTVSNNVSVAVNSTTVCAGQSATLTATPSVAGGTFSWSPGNQTTPNISVSPSTTTNYTVAYFLSGCSASSVGSVIVNPLPIASVIIVDTNILPGENTNLIASGGGTYVWSNGQTASSIFVAPPQTIVYCVTVKNSSGCSDSACAEVKVTCPSTLYIPNCFTPNGDLVNELFTVPSTCIKEFHIMIYNRWGQLIFESTNLQNSWDGKYQGNPVPDGVYVYVIEAKGYDNTIYKKPGHVTVLR